MNSLTSKIKNLKSWLIDVRRDLHKTPELGLEEFLTNKRYIVVVDGDEYAIYDHIKKSGLFDTSKIIHDSYAEEQEKWHKQYLAQLEKEKKDADFKHEN